MTKKDLAREIEDDGRYDRIKIDAKGNVTGHPVGEPDRYTSATNSGGRRLLGYDTELLAALVECGRVDSDIAETYVGI